MTVPRRSPILGVLKIAGWTSCALILALWGVSARWDVVAWRGGWEVSVARGRWHVHHWPAFTPAWFAFPRTPVRPAWKHHSRAVVDVPWPARFGLGWHTRVEWSPRRRIVAGPFWMLLLGAASLTAAFHRLDRRAVKPGVCPCGYDLRGNTSGRCPECGADVLRPAPGEGGA